MPVGSQADYFEKTRTASIEEQRENQVPDRKLTPFEKAALDRLHDSNGSTESSIFSSHPVASTAARFMTAVVTCGNGVDRSSILDDVDSVGVGMTGKSDDDADTWAGFPAPSSRALDFPLPSSTEMIMVEKEAPIQQVPATRED